MVFIKPDENGKYPTKALPSRLLLAIRILVALYLFYLAYGLKDAFILPIAKENVLIIVATIIFTLAATVIIILSVRSLLIGQFQGGKLDVGVIDDDAVKHIDGLDDPDKKVETHISSSKDSSADEFDPHNVVYKRDQSDDK